MQAAIVAIESHLPGLPITNEDLAADYPEWQVDRIAAKTGILQRHYAAKNEYASDLACSAAEKLFASGICTPEEIDFVLLCTQSPDYFLPTTACLLQQRLGVPQRAGALDFNLGCSGYVYGLGLAQGLIATGQASRILFLTGETYSKWIKPGDRSSATIFGDAGTATLIAAKPVGETHQPAYVYGTDGGGAEHLIVKSAAMRDPAPALSSSVEPQSFSDFLWMNGPEIFHFAMKVVPGCVQALLDKAGLEIDDIDLFVFHQANRYMLDHLRAKLAIPEEKFYVSFTSSGNTVSATIPIALEDALAQKRLKVGQKTMLVGFGVGLSWGATLLTWPYLGTHAAGS